MTGRREWLIDVCRTCERIAAKPYCEHYRTWQMMREGTYPPSPYWAERVAVVEKDPR